MPADPIIDVIAERILAGPAVRRFVNRLCWLGAALAAALAGGGFLLAAVYLALTDVLRPVYAALILAAILLLIALAAALCAARRGRARTAASPRQDLKLIARSALPLVQAMILRRPVKSVLLALLGGMLTEWLIADPDRHPPKG